MNRSVKYKGVIVGYINDNDAIEFNRNCKEADEVKNLIYSSTPIFISSRRMGTITDDNKVVIDRELSNEVMLQYDTKTFECDNCGTIRTEDGCIICGAE